VGAVPPGPETTRAAAAQQLWAMQVAMVRGEHRFALGHAQEVERLHGELGFESDFSSSAWMTAAICAVMLGEPEGAMEVADRYSETALAFATGDAITALIHLGLGDLEPATVAVRAHARIAVSHHRLAGSGRSSRTIGGFRWASRTSETSRVWVRRLLPIDEAASLFSGVLRLDRAKQVIGVTAHRY
jgi:hypothetical protein